ncbi:ATP-binding protein [Actinomadura miaoliensis]|uniref:Histidine kinase/HSP90-like ATPase domain-containing protein n=1 Tax=Actinomadura miaoliensis TaxID=430685 RepID=A0ABP7WZX6_9ACTN
MHTQHVEGWPFIERHQLAATKNAPYWARRLVADVLERWRMPDLTESALLLTSEVVTNAVVAVGGLELKEAAHARSVRLKLSTDYTHLLVEVWDPINQPPVLGSMVPLDSEQGRGLFLVDTFAKDWNYYHPAAGGKVVWFLLERPARPARAG